MKYKLLLTGLILVMIVVAVLSGFTIGMITPIVSSIFGETHASSGPWIFRWIINWIESSDKMGSIVRLSIMLVVIYGIKFPFSLVLCYFSDSLEQKTIMDIKVEMFEKLTALSYGFHSITKSGDMLSKMTNDSEKIRFALRRGVIDLFRNLFLLLVYLGLAFWASWRLFLISIVLIPFMVLIIQYIGKKVRGRFTNLRKQRAFINSLASEMLQGIKVIKSFGMESYEQDRFREVNKEYRNNFIKSHLIKKFLPASSELLGAIIAGVILVVGGILIFQGTITPDKFLVFLGSAVMMMHPARQINLAYGDLQHGLASMESVLEVIEAEDYIEDEGSKVLDSLEREIEFEDIYFSYNEGKNILRDINLRIERGETLAIVGPSGSGKSTLVNLIPRFFEIKDGRIKIDGVDIREYTLRSLRDRIGMVTQEVILFNDTIRNNILYGKSGATDEELNDVLEKSHLKDFVYSLPDGLETEVGEKGGRISGGEKQRIAIARAILKDPDILIFDEATSSLDAESERLVHDAMSRLLTGRTALVIAHRLSTVIDADRIIVLDEGRIVEEGTHQELIKKGGVYSYLYKLQFKDSAV